MNTKGADNFSNPSIAISARRLGGRPCLSPLKTDALGQTPSSGNPASSKTPATPPSDTTPKSSSPSTNKNALKDDLVYFSDTGEFSYHGKTIGHAHSGHDEGFDNPAKEDIKDTGPIPTGRYAMGTEAGKLLDPHHGFGEKGKTKAAAIPLTPLPTTDTHGRGLEAPGRFLIHPHLLKQPGSHGCVVLDHEGKVINLAHFIENNNIKHLRVTQHTKPAPMLSQLPMP